MYVRNGSTNLASFTGSSAQIGQSSTSHTVVDSAGMRTYASDGTTLISDLGYGEGQGQSGNAYAPYFTLGDRKANTTIGNYSFALGRFNEASGYASHTEGVNNVARGRSSHAEGEEATATGVGSHAENNALASGSYSHAEGNGTASGTYSHAQNFMTVAGYSSQTAIGEWNDNKSTNAFEIGNGADPNDRSNAFEVDWNGNVNIASGAKYKINGNNLSASDIANSVTGVKGNAESSYRTGNVNLTAANIGAVPTSRTVNSKALSSNITLSASDVSALPLSGGTMTGQILTSFKSSVAMGSYGAAAATVDGLVTELRYSSGCMGSASIGTAYTKGSVTIGTGWYNFIYSPHRSGGANGAASGDNCNYGNLLLMGMTVSGAYLIRVASAAIQEVKILGSDYVRATFTPTSGSSYSNYGGCYYEKYGRVVHVHVGVSGLSTGASTNIYTLPSGYRPTSPVFAHGTGGAWNNIGYLEISTAGVVTVRSQGTYCGADVTFMT